MVCKESTRRQALLLRRCLIPVLLLLRITLSAQVLDEAEDQQPTFHVMSELVVLPVNVTDAGGNFIFGLTADNFRVYEDGRLQKVILFEHEDIPVTVGLIVDHSRSMGPKLSAVTAAITNFAHSSNSQDEMFVVDFSDRVWPELFGGELFTSDVKQIESAINSVGAEGQTALYDAVYEGLSRLRMGHRNKKALIIVSDGGDNASRRQYNEILEFARRSQAIIYAIGLIDQAGEEENPRLLSRLCKDTGGLVLFPAPVSKVGEASLQIAADLRQQYTVGYVPDKRTGLDAFRKVRVKVLASGRGKLLVRTRAGYSAGRRPGSPPKGPS